MKDLEERIKSHEGFRSFAYQCPAGKTTIGFGRNVDANGGLGITKEEALYLLKNDIKRCHDTLYKRSWYKPLDVVRKDVMIELLYNMGLTSLLTFKRMIAAINQEDFELASNELMDSKWAKEDVGSNRSADIRFRLRYGALPGDKLV